jgi:hypothetical protein
VRKAVETGDYLPHVIDGPNIWRAKAGDRLVRIGTKQRMDVPWPMMSIVDLTANALVVGETNNKASDPLLFGAVTDEDAAQRDGDLFRAGIDAVERLGTPRTVSTKWSIGWT